MAMKWWTGPALAASLLLAAVASLSVRDCEPPWASESALKRDQRQGERPPVATVRAAWCVDRMHCAPTRAECEESRQLRDGSEPACSRRAPEQWCMGGDWCGASPPDDADECGWIAQACTARQSDCESRRAHRPPSATECIRLDEVACLTDPLGGLNCFPSVENCERRRAFAGTGYSACRAYR